MKCTKCGRDFPSDYYLKTESLCLECYGKMNPEEQRKAIRQMVEEHRIAIRQAVEEEKKAISTRVEELKKSILKLSLG